MRCFLMTVNLENNVISVFVVSIFFGGELVVMGGNENFWFCD
jgi:hypothetical protein